MVPLLMEDHKKIIAAEDSRLTPSQKAQGYGFNPRFPRMDAILPFLVSNFIQLPARARRVGRGQLNHIDARAREARKQLRAEGGAQHVHPQRHAGTEYVVRVKG